jgi:hypothetical protein
MLHDPSHYEPPPIAHEIVLSKLDKDVLRTLASRVGRDRCAAGSPRKSPALAAAQRPGLGSPDGLDQRDLLARNERRRRVDVGDTSTLGSGSGTRPAADALPVAPPAGRHDCQRLSRLPARHPQHRLRDHRGRGRGPDRRRRATLSRGTSTSRFAGFRRSRKDQDACGHPQRGGHRVPLPGDVRGLRRDPAREKAGSDAHIGSRPGTTSFAGGASSRR